MKGGRGADRPRTFRRAKTLGYASRTGKAGGIGRQMDVGLLSHGESQALRWPIFPYDGQFKTVGTLGILGHLSGEGGPQ